ncbi:MAG TPA: response regulator transcription factor [Burkholderiales bacterium]
MNTIHVITVDDHAILRAGLRLIFAATPEIRVVAEASGGAEALSILGGIRVDVAIVEFSMAEMNGIELTQKIRADFPETRVVVLSMHGSAEFAHRALRAGALAYVLKASAPDELFDAVRSAASGTRYLSPVLRESVLDHVLEQGSPTPLERLSARERQVLQLLVEGHTSRAIGERLSVSTKSIETYRRRLMDKLGIHDIPQLVRFAIEHGVTRGASS